MALDDRKRKVLFVKHTQMPCVNSLEAALNHACWLNDLRFESRLSLEANVFERMGEAIALIADLTHNDAFVLHDVGVAHALSLPVLCLCHRRQDHRLADLQGERVIYYGDLQTAEEKDELSRTLAVRLRQILGGGYPDVIDSFRERTRRIIQDLELLGRHEDLGHQTIWYSGFLSAFSLSEEGLEPGEQALGVELLKEKATLFELARKGCRMICIISPPGKSVRSEKAALVRTRIQCLLDFIGNHPELPIDWVLSPYLQKNFYIIGEISCIERFQKVAALGVDLTLRQSSESAIQANRAVYQSLVERLILIMFPDGLPAADIRRQCMRDATARLLESGLAICDYALRTKEAP